MPFKPLLNLSFITFLKQNDKKENENEKTQTLH